MGVGVKGGGGWGREADTTPDSEGSRGKVKVDASVKV